MERVDFVTSRIDGTAEQRQVIALVDALCDHLSSPGVVDEIALANQPGQSSGGVQGVFLEEARRLGFRDESKGLFSDYGSSALRPDYFLDLGKTGILLEVERGKTTINNMDLLDFWKCHICVHAHYLILMVPLELRQNPTMTPRREFASVTKRLATFFEPRNYTNVRGLFLLGY